MRACEILESTDNIKHISEIERIQKEYARRNKEIAADYYSLEHPGNLFIYKQRLKAVTKVLAQENFSLPGKKILEIGCGEGQWLADLET